MNNKYLLAMVAAIGITAAATTAIAAPLPDGTVLKLGPTAGQGGLIPCTSGSCFVWYCTTCLFYWTPINPGTDGGIVIGKPQLSGGQEINGLSTADGELSAVWNWGANWGTFFTAPDATGNIFDDAACTGADCIGKTELKVFNAAWNGVVIPLGSAAGCDKVLLPACTTNMVNGIFVKTWTINPVEGGAWRLTYEQVAPMYWTNFHMGFILSGTVHFLQNRPPVVVVTPANLTGFDSTPIPFTISVTDPDGPAPPNCRVGTPPGNGTVLLNGCTSGTYTPYVGSFGIYYDNFTIIANDSQLESAPFSVPVATVIDDPRPTAGNVNITGNYGIPLAWTPVVTNATSCRIATLPSNGMASVASNCSTGSYTADIGFVGTDSFTYIASGFGGSNSLPATVTAAITAPDTDTGCIAQYPLRQITLTGKQGHLSMTVTGNITSVNPNGKEIKICPTTTATYAASTNTPKATVVCRIKSNTARGQGNVKVNDHIKCTDKPIGNDKLGIKIKSGVNQKAM